jgi:pyridoxine 5-phosphate synthase
MAVTDEMIQYALKIKPHHCCLVPEKRAELTTEGGLDVVSQEHKIADAVKTLQSHHIQVSLFIDPELKQIEAAERCQAQAIEIHTGCYADDKNILRKQHELERIIHAVNIAEEAGLIINAGHGLHYHNVQAIAAIPQINELNIGHAIIARAMMTGMNEAVSTMKRLMEDARANYCCEIHE